MNLVHATEHNHDGDNKKNDDEREPGVHPPYNGTLHISLPSDVAAIQKSYKI